MRRASALVLLAAVAVAAPGCGEDEPADEPAARREPPRTREAPAPRPRPSRRPRRERSNEPPFPARAVSIDGGPGRRRRVALTFDADMTSEMLDQLRSGEVGSWYNEEVVDVLRETRTKATLFIAGLWAKAYPREVRRFARDPLFELGSHTWDHRAWTGDCYGLPAVSDLDEKRREVTRTARVLRRLTGREPFWFRFPGLCAGEEDLRLVSSLGEQPVGGLGSGDAFQADPGVIVDTVLEQVRPGAIIVMHMMGGPNAPATGEALKALIPALEERGYRPVTLSKLLAPTRRGGRAGR